MDFIPGILGGASTLILFCILGGTLMKVLQISGELREVKEMVQELRRGKPSAVVSVQPLPAAPPPIPAHNSAPISPEELVRAVHAQGYDAIAAEADALPPHA